ncbi:MAG: NADH-quinone oxidoreductase subunit J [Bacteroidota bacterium]|jgi:NADH-quinone oxidoreductase subunit J|nr:NADH-quinone oxidoreductase subunit J [Bacteroidota bacterium]
MGITQILFWFLTILALVAAIGVISSKNPIYSVLWLIVVFFAISGHYILMNAQFLAIVNIIVYAGAIMVLFLFVIMLMNLNAEAEPVKNVYMKMAGIISGLTLMIVLVAALSHSDVQNTIIRPGTSIGLIKNLGKALFNQYVVPFEISSVLFLSAMIGAIMLGKKDPVKKISL